MVFFPELHFLQFRLFCLDFKSPLISSILVAQGIDKSAATTPSFPTYSSLLLTSYILQQ